MLNTEPMRVQNYIKCKLPLNTCLQLQAEKTM